MDMTETPDGIFIVFVSRIPYALEIHVRTQVDHSKRSGCGTEIKKSGIGSIHHDLHKI
jgi:hypothetical protein